MLERSVMLDSVVVLLKDSMWRWGRDKCENEKHLLRLCREAPVVSESSGSTIYTTKHTLYYMQYVYLWMCYILLSVINRRICICLSRACAGVQRPPRDSGRLFSKQSRVVFFCGQWSFAIRIALTPFRMMKNIWWAEHILKRQQWTQIYLLYYVVQGANNAMGYWEEVKNGLQKLIDINFIFFWA